MLQPPTFYETQHEAQPETPCETQRGALREAQPETLTKTQCQAKRRAKRRAEQVAEGTAKRYKGPISKDKMVRTVLPGGPMPKTLFDKTTVARSCVFGMIATKKTNVKVESEVADVGYYLRVHDAVEFLRTIVRGFVCCVSRPAQNEAAADKYEKSTMAIIRKLHNAQPLNSREKTHFGSLKHLLRNAGVAPAYIMRRDVKLQRAPQNTGWSHVQHWFISHEMANGTALKITSWGRTSSKQRSAFCAELAGIVRKQVLPYAK